VVIQRHAADKFCQADGKRKRLNWQTISTFSVAV
jgi:hypothetical protein